MPVEYVALKLPADVVGVPEECGRRNASELFKDLDKICLVVIARVVGDFRQG